MKYFFFLNPVAISRIEYFGKTHILTLKKLTVYSLIPGTDGHIQLPDKRKMCFKIELFFQVYSAPSIEKYWSKNFL